METTTQRLFGIDEASERAGLPAWRIYSEVAAARVPGKRVGRVYFTEAAIVAYFERIKQERQSERPAQVDGPFALP